MSDDSSNKKDNTIIIYRTSWCAFCHTEMQWLDRLGIPYEAKDIEADQTAYDELMKKIGGDFHGVPVTDIGGDIIFGFNRPQLQQSMKTHGISPAVAA